MADVKPPYFLGIDVGTQGLRSGIFDARGNVVASLLILILSITPVRGGQSKILLTGGEQLKTRFAVV